MAEVARSVEAEAFYDWGGGLIWLAAPAGSDAAATTIRAAVKAAGGGHATLFRASEVVRAAVAVFEPQPAIARRVKEAFDPNGVLNPGRMAPEF